MSADSVPLPPEVDRDDQGRLCVEGVPLAQLAARFGTPLYVYSAAHLDTRLAMLRRGFHKPPLICYAVKANDNLGILRRFAAAGTGFDIVSGGELVRVLAAGGDPTRVVFSGVGKRDDELQAALQAGVRAIHLESIAEADRLSAIAAATGRKAPVAVRVNPDVDPGTHPHIATGMRKAKFGVAWDDVPALYRRLVADPWLVPIGAACHIGSQLLDVAPLLAALDRMLGLVDQLASAGLKLQYLDLGGGLGVRYQPEDGEPDLRAYAAGIEARLAGRDLDLILEPGRFLVAGAGLLLTRVLYPKRTPERLLAVVDASMSELMRPALYGAWHGIVPVQDAPVLDELIDVVGPVCESTDVLGRDRYLPEPSPGRLLALTGVGAYGSTMANTYNTRPRPAEVLVEGGRVAVMRRRETVADLLDRDRQDLQWEAP